MIQASTQYPMGWGFYVQAQALSELGLMRLERSERYDPGRTTVDVRAVVGGAS